MRKNYFRLVITAFIAALLFAGTAFSQSMFFYNPDITKYPEVKVRFQGYNAVGNPFELVNTDFNVQEKGKSMNETVKVDFSKKPDTPSVSIIIMMDVSGTMNKPAPNSDESKLEWMKKAVRAFIDSLYFVNNTRVALVTFESGSRLHRDYQTTREGVGDYVDGHNPPKTIGAGLRDFKRAFLGPEVDVLGVLSAAPPDAFRHIILITDGYESDRDFLIKDIDTISNRLKRVKTVVHSVAINTKLDSWNTGGISEATGGKRYDKIVELSDLISKLQYLAGYIQRRDYGVLSWIAPYGCDEQSRARSYEIQNSRIQSIVEKNNYTAPPESVIKFQIDNNELIFGLPNDGQIDQKFKITYRGPQTTVNKLSFSEVGFFDIVDLKPPFTIKDGDVKDIKVRYILTPPGPPKEITLSLESDDFLCGELPSVKLISSCNASAAKSFNFGTVMQSLSETKTISKCFTNNASIPLQVDIALQGANASEFKLKSSSANVAPGKSIDVEVTFTPSKSSGVSNASIEFTYKTECGGSKSTSLTGEAEPNSIEENLVGEGSAFKLRAEPNPANGFVKISFETPSQANYRLDLYDSMGSLVDNLLNKNVFSGSYQADYNVSNLSSGVYILRLQSATGSESFRFVVTK